MAEDPSILGIGELILKDKERNQPGAGRLDLLFQDPDCTWSEHLGHKWELAKVWFPGL